MNQEWFTRLWQSDYNKIEDCDCIDDLDLSKWKVSSPELLSIITTLIAGKSFRDIIESKYARYEIILDGPTPLQAMVIHDI